MPPLCMIKGSIVAVASNKWTITETWIPTTMQLGSQVYCAVATDNAQIQSDQYCLTFNSPGEAPVTTTTTTTTSTTSTTTTITTATITFTRTTTAATFLVLLSLCCCCWWWWWWLLQVYFNR
ncbi:unnamed protein product [Rotaria socialis]